MARPDTEFLDAFEAIPRGTSRGRFNGKTWIVSKTALADGRAEKLIARELGGRGYVSMNVYRLPRGPLLKPCEMPVSVARAFVLGFEGERPRRGQ